MKMLVPAVAALGVLAIGAVPAAGFSFAGSAGPTVAAGPAKPADKNADGKPGYGPPPHAHSRHNADRGKGPQDDGRPGPAERRRDKQHTHAADMSALGHAAEMSALGRAHGEAMREWSRCVDGQQGHDAERDAEQACGAKPVPPGHLKHLAKGR